MIVSYLRQPNAVFVAQEIQKSHVQAKEMQTNIYGFTMREKALNHVYTTMDGLRNYSSHTGKRSRGDC